MFVKEMGKQDISKTSGKDLMYKTVSQYLKVSLHLENICFMI